MNLYEVDEGTEGRVYLISAKSLDQAMKTYSTSRLEYIDDQEPELLSISQVTVKAHLTSRVDLTPHFTNNSKSEVISVHDWFEFSEEEYEEDSD
jgi:hypothetical protein